MRFVYVVYSPATEVVLLLKLGGNEVFFRHKSAENLWVLHRDTQRDKVIPLIFYTLHKQNELALSRRPFPKEIFTICGEKKST
jgi:hypothetical protein